MKFPWNTPAEKTISSKIAQKRNFFWGSGKDWKKWTNHSLVAAIAEPSLCCGMSCVLSQLLAVLGFDSELVLLPQYSDGSVRSLKSPEISGKREVLQLTGQQLSSGVIFVISIQPDVSSKAWQEAHQVIRLPVPQSTAVCQERAWILDLLLSQAKEERVWVPSVNGCVQRLALVLCRPTSSFLVCRASRGWKQPRPEEWNTADLHWGWVS